MSRSNNEIEAKRQILNQLLNIVAHEQGLWKAVTAISNIYNLPYDDLMKWTLETQQQMSTETVVADETNIESKKVPIQTPVNNTLKLVAIAKKTETTVAKKEESKPTVIRRAAVSSNIATNKPSVVDIDMDFKKQVLESADIYTKLDAIASISDKEILKDIYEETDDNLVKKEIIRVSRYEPIINMALKETEAILRIEAIKACYTSFKLRWAAENDPSDKVRTEAVRRVKDPNVLQKIFLNDNSDQVRKTAISQIRSVPMLNELVKKAGNEDPIKKDIEQQIESVKALPREDLLAVL